MGIICGLEVKSNKSDGYFHAIIATIAWVKVSCQASHSCSSCSSQLSIIDDCLSLPVACIAPASTMKASQ